MLEPSPRRWVFAVLWVGGVGAIYGASLGYPFVFDDISAIVHNPTLTAPSLWAALAPPNDTSVSGRPLVNLSFALQQHLFGPRPQSFRAGNVLLHVLNACLIFGLLTRALASARIPERIREHGELWAALITGLWACHPLQTEAVVYVTQRTELLASTFLLLTLLAAQQALTDEARARLWTLLATLACALGTSCKEILVAAPCCVLALDRSVWSGSWSECLRKHGRLYVCLLLALVPVFVQLLTQPRDRTAGFALGVSPWQALALGGHVVARYLRLSVWPAPLSVSYAEHYAGALTRYWRADLAVAALAAWTAARALRGRPSALLWVLFFCVLAPTSSLVPILSEPMAERRMYLPLLAPIGTLVFTVASLAPQTARLGAALICLLLTAASATAAHARVRDYRSAEALFAAALAADPDNPQAMWGLAAALDERGQSQQALALYERMAERPFPYDGPASWGTRGLLGAAGIHERAGRRERAQRTRERALDHDPESTIGGLYRAARLVAVGQEPLAISVLEGLLARPFLHERVHRELAALYARQGDTARAALQLAAAERDP